MPMKTKKTLNLSQLLIQGLSQLKLIKKKKPGLFKINSNYPINLKTFPIKKEVTTSKSQKIINRKARKR
jgi:hypothetical protein